MKKNIVLTILLLIFTFILIVLAPISYKTVKAYQDSNAFADSILEIQQKN